MKRAERYWRGISWVIITANAISAVLLIAAPERLTQQLLFGGLLGFAVRLYLYFAGHALHKQKLQFSLYGLEFCSAGLLVRWNTGPLWTAELLLIIGILVQLHIVARAMRDAAIEGLHEA